MNNLLVTILMPVFNGELFVADAIESVLSQSYSNFEFIIIDDGSNDQTHSIIFQYIQNDNRIKLFTNEINSGIVDSLNKGIKLARGEYIFRLDADDLTDPHRISRQLSFMESHELDWSATAYQLINSEGIKRKIKKYPTLTLPNVDISDPEDLFLSFMHSTLIAHGTVCFRSKIFIDHCYQNVKAEDLRLWIDLCKAGVKMGFLPEVLYSYRVNENGLFRQNRLSISNEAKVYHGELTNYFLKSKCNKLHVYRRAFCLLYRIVSLEIKIFAKFGLKSAIKSSYYLLVYLRTKH
jgi:glycosyltransferase involved in cell wall biosynthesis